MSPPREAVPDLKLTFGQLAWTINRGRPPDNVLLDQLRYLRQLGIPLTEKERGGGRGNRISYNFYHLIECGLGVVALRRGGMKPGEISRILVSHRLEMRRWFGKIYRAIPEHLINKDALRVPMQADLTEVMLQLNGRFSPQPGTFMFAEAQPEHSGSGWGTFAISRPPIDEDPDLDQSRFGIPILQYIAGWLAYAREAPITPPGRKPRAQGGG